MMSYGSRKATCRTTSLQLPGVSTKPSVGRAAALHSKRPAARGSSPRPWAPPCWGSLAGARRRPHKVPARTCRGSQDGVHAGERHGPVAAQQAGRHGRAVGAAQHRVPPHSRRHRQHPPLLPPPLVGGEAQAPARDPTSPAPCSGRGEAAPCCPPGLCGPEPPPTLSPCPPAVGPGPSREPESTARRGAARRAVQSAAPPAGWAPASLSGWPPTWTVVALLRSEPGSELAQKSLTGWFFVVLVSMMLDWFFP